MNTINFGPLNPEDSDDQYDIVPSSDFLDREEYEAGDVADSDYDWENDYTDENEL
jgi:hypothetical protein